MKLHILLLNAIPLIVLYINTLHFTHTYSRACWYLLYKYTVRCKWRAIGKVKPVLFLWQRIVMYANTHRALNVISMCLTCVYPNPNDNCQAFNMEDIWMCVYLCLCLCLLVLSFIVHFTSLFFCSAFVHGIRQSFIELFVVRMSAHRYKNKSQHKLQTMK